MTTAKHQILIIGGGTAGIRWPHGCSRRATPTSRSSNRRTSTTTSPCGHSSAGASQGLDHRTLGGVGDAESGAHGSGRPPATFDPDNNTVTCADGSTYEYDVLVVCPGIQLDWHRTEG